MRGIILIIAITVYLTGQAAAQVTGRGVALGSDILQINGRVFQLHGVDAVELHQFCFVDGQPWACGASATRAFQVLLDPVIVTCTPTGEVNSAVAFATCTSAEGDLAEIMVRQGWALVYRPQSDAYVAAEEAARATAAGVWRGRFVEPWEYRADIAAIEQRYVARAMEALRAEAEGQLRLASGGMGIFKGFVLTEAAAAPAATPAFEVRTAAIPIGFIREAIEERGVFDWNVVAGALEVWGQSVTPRVLQAAAASFWSELAGRPGPTVEAADASVYYRLINRSAAAWISAGRQPILLVRSPGSPAWISSWFSGSPPEGALVTRKEGTARGYLGTIDGIDVYVGVTPLAQSLLFPDDVLVEIVYGLRENGAILTAELDGVPDPDEMVFRYSRLVRWSADLIVKIGHPYEAPDNPYGANPADVP